MKRYILITNIWGRKAHKIYGWNYKDPTRNSIECDEERIEFDTMEELNEHLRLFQDFCNTFNKAERKDHYNDVWLHRNSRYHSYNDRFEFNTPNDRAWGWLIADREKLSWIWGGEKLREYDNRSNKLILKDKLFRGPDEIPKNYKWDDGEYEGWLQNRWGDGKNAIGYEDKKTNKTSKSEKVIEEDYDYGKYEMMGEEIEDQFAKVEDKETIKKLENRW